MQTKAFWQALAASILQDAVDPVEHSSHLLADREVGGRGSRSRTAFINSSGWVAAVDRRTDDAGSGCDRIDVQRDGALRAKQLESRRESALVGRLEARPAATGRGVGQGFSLPGIDLHPFTLHEM